MRQRLSIAAVLALVITVLPAVVSAQTSEPKLTVIYYYLPG